MEVAMNKYKRKVPFFGLEEDFSNNILIELFAGLNSPGFRIDKYKCTFKLSDGSI